MQISLSYSDLLEYFKGRDKILFNSANVLW